MLPIEIEMIAITPPVTTTWNSKGVVYAFLGMTVEDAHELMAWTAALAKNQREWQAYAAFWERRAKELGE